MQMPQVTDHHRKLGALAGTFVGEETIYETPWGPGGKATGRCIGRVGMDGFGVIVDYEQERGGEVTYRGHGVYGWHAGRDAYTMYWADSMGGVPDRVTFGHWEGDELIFEAECEDGNRSRYVYTFSGEDTYRFRIENSSDGGASWKPFMEGDFRRV